MQKQQRAVIVAARRTPVAPRGGALAAFQCDELAAPVLAQLITDAGLDPARVDHVLLGNALYGGGNPARMAALRAGLQGNVPAMTIDTQCCSGLDAILLGARLIEAGAAQCVLAGGVESFSRSPIRMHRPLSAAEPPLAYLRPAFAPPPYDDPDLASAAANLAMVRNISRAAQADFAVASHAKAMAAGATLEHALVRVDGMTNAGDGFTRALSKRAALRAPVLAGDPQTGLSAATIACEADGAAAVLLLSEDLWREAGPQARSGLVIVRCGSLGGDPGAPASVPDDLAQDLLAQQGLRATDLDVLELMEAYAPQAMATAEALGIAQASLNPLGGALARGHPIGASGAVLAVQLALQLARPGSGHEGAKKTGMALIAAAGGLGAGILVETVQSGAYSRA